MIFSKKGQNPSFLSIRYVVVTEERISLFVDKIQPENTEHPTQQTVSCSQTVQFPALCKYLKCNKHRQPLLGEKNLLVNLSMDIIFSSKLTVFFEFHSRKTLSFGTDNVCGLISAHIFTLNGSQCSYSYQSLVT